MTATVSPVSSEEALTHIAAIVEFAYQHGFHELGYDPVDVIRRAPAASGAKVPEGWQIVPKVLRQGMDEAMDRAMKLGSNQHLWDAALAAAPVPPDPNSNEGNENGR